MDEGRKTKFGLEERNIAVCIILVIFTGIIYNIYWRYQLIKGYNNVNNTPDKIATETLLSVFIPFYYLYWIYTRTHVFTRNMRQKGYSIEDNSTMYLLFSIFGFVIVADAMIQNSFNQIVNGTIMPSQNGSYNEYQNNSPVNNQGKYSNSTTNNPQQCVSSQMTKDDFVEFVRIQKKQDMSPTTHIELSEEVALEFKNNIERGKIYLEDKEWNKAYLFFEKALNINPKSSECYFGEFLTNLQKSNESELLSMRAPFYANKNYINAIKYADSKRKTELINLSYEIMYLRANELLEKKKYSLSKELFLAIEDYKDSAEFIEKCAEQTLEDDYLKAKDLSLKNKWLEANKILKTIPQFKDSEQLIKENEQKYNEDMYNRGTKLKEEKTFDNAKIVFGKIIEYKDSKNQIQEIEKLQTVKSAKNKKTLIIISIVIAVVICATIALTTIPPLLKYNKASDLLANKQFDAAKELFVELGDYDNSAEMVFECDYQKGNDLIKEKNYFLARKLFVQISTYKDSKTMINEADYLEGYDFYQNKNYIKAIACFDKCGSYKNTKDLLDKVFIAYADEFYEKKDYVNAFKYYDKVSYGGSISKDLEGKRIKTADEMCSKGDYLSAYGLIQYKMQESEYNAISRKVLIGLLNQGVTKYNSGKYTEAETMLKYVTGNKRNVSTALFDKAEAYLVFISAKKGNTSYYKLSLLLSYPEARRIIENDFELMKYYLCGTDARRTWEQTGGGDNEFIFYSDGRFGTTLKKINHIANSYNYRDGGIYYDNDLAFQIIIADENTISILCAADGKYYTFDKSYK